MMKKLTITSTQRKELRINAHHLNPVVMIGNDGLSQAVIKEADAALNAHGLIKIRVLGDDRDERTGMATTLCDGLGAALVQHIGKLIILYRPIPEKEETEDPDRMPGPRVHRVVKASRSGRGRPTISKVRVMGNERLTKGGLVKPKRTTQKSTKKAP